MFSMPSDIHLSILRASLLKFHIKKEREQTCMAKLIAQGDATAPFLKSVAIINARIDSLRFVVDASASVLGYQARFANILDGSPAFMVAGNYESGERLDLSSEDTMSVLRTMLRGCKIKNDELEELNTLITDLSNVTPLALDSKSFGPPMGKFYTTGFTEAIKSLLEAQKELVTWRLTPIETKDPHHVYVDFVSDMDSDF